MPLESLVLNVEMLIETFFSIPMKLHDKIVIENCLFINKSMNFDLPSIFNNWFTFSSESHRYKTSCSFKGFLKFNNKIPRIMVEKP